MAPGEVAAALGVTSGRVRQLAIAGELVEAFRLWGKRVYRRADVRRFQVRRKAARRGVRKTPRRRAAG